MWLTGDSQLQKRNSEWFDGQNKGFLSFMPGECLLVGMAFAQNTLKTKFFKVETGDYTMTPGIGGCYERD